MSDTMTPGMPDPCNPIGCDNGIHLPGCVFDVKELTLAHLGYVRKHPLANCENCPYGTDLTKPVLGVGPEGTVKVAVVGEAPGQHEDFVGRPFVGPSGQILNEILRNNDIDRGDVWITNAVACQPPNNATPPQAAIDACYPRMLEELVDHDPEYVLALGTTAAKALGLKGSMSNLRVGPPKSAPYQHPRYPDMDTDFQVIPTFHPAYALRLPDALPTIDFDFAKINKGTTAELWRRPVLTVVNDLESAGDAILDLWEMEGPFSVDIETGFEKDETDFHADQRPLLCIGVCYELGKVVVFGKNVMTDSRVMENLALLFRDKPLTMHYGKSDVAGMYPIMGATNLRHDTLLKHYSLDERTGGHKLETLGIELLGVPAWKQMVKPYLAKGKEKNFADIPEDVLYPYNAIDCDVTYRLNLMFSKQLEEQGRTKLPNFLVRASNELVYPEMDGIGFDMPYSIKLSEEYQEALKANEVKINELLNNPQVQVEVVDEEGQKQYPLVNLNPRSPKQLLELFGQRGWKIPVEKSKQTTAAPALQRGLELGWYDTDQTALNFLELLFENRKITKDDGTFCRGLQKQAVKLADGSYRIHTTYTLHVATTGRLSSKSPNLQNVKDDKKIRRQFIATDGNLLLQGDYSQVEGRVIAVLSGDQYLCDLFRNTERDIFDELSVGMYGRLLKDKRRLLKTFFYGLSYGRTAHGIANGFGMDIKYASDQLEQFKKLIPGVIEWQEETWQKVQDQGYLETTFGRRRHFPLITNRNKDDVRNEALAFVPQSTASDICLTAFTHLRPALEEAFDEEVRIRLTIHDAIVTEGPRGLEGEMQQMMEGLMTASGNVWARGQDSDIPFQVAFKSGTSWDQLG